MYVKHDIGAESNVLDFLYEMYRPDQDTNQRMNQR